jgi:hypothetical protein
MFMPERFQLMEEEPPPDEVLPLEPSPSSPK